MLVALVHFDRFLVECGLSTLSVQCTLNFMATLQALVSGAGIAGAAAAYWLRKAGLDVTVVERAAAPRPGGQTVDLRGAGRTVVERMGLLDQIRSMTVTQRGIAWVDE